MKSDAKRIERWFPKLGDVLWFRDDAFFINAYSTLTIQKGSKAIVLSNVCTIREEGGYNTNLYHITLAVLGKKVGKVFWREQSYYDLNGFGTFCRCIDVKDL